MNLVGKILTVFILVMSLVFMSFAVAVYATHQNWRDVVMRPKQEAGPGKPPGLTHQLQDERTKNDDLQAAKNALEARLTAERDAAVQALAKLGSEFDQLKLQHDQLRKDFDAIDQERREALAQMKNTEARLAALRVEIEGDQNTLGLRQEKLQAQKQREQYFNEVLRLTDEKHNLVNQLKSFRDRQRVLQQDLDKAVAVLRLHDLKPEPDLYRSQPPLLDGYVRGTQGDKYVEISLGSDEGLLKGHTLEVYRPSGYVARIEVVKTDIDRSVCQLVPGTVQSRVQRNDLVTSKLLR